MTDDIRPTVWQEPPRAGTEWWQLATYNAEVARGIVHTDEWKAKMAAEQARFDARPKIPATPRHWWQR